MMKRLLTCVACLLLTSLYSWGITTDSISQWGITWYFDTGYETGQFANGDWWVVGPVTIDSITPNFTGTRNGWEVNPIVSGGQGFDDRARSFDAGLVPSLPYNSSSNESIVKALSGDCCRTGYVNTCIKTVAVLTVVPALPPDSGATVFRPPYIADEKPYYSVNDLRTDLIPSYTPPVWEIPSRIPTLEQVYDRFKRVQFDHKNSALGCDIKPCDYMISHAYDNAVWHHNGIIRLMLDDPLEQKMPALITYVQMGIDKYHSVLNGQYWANGGGYQPGHKVVLTFASVMLDNDAIKTTMDTATFTDQDIVFPDLFNEDRGIYRSTVTGRALFGFPPPQGSEKTQKDPYEYIDAPNGGYLGCCLANPWKGTALAILLMPSLQTVWDGSDWDKFIELVDRWVEHGWWYLPDPYNRHPEKHGTEADGGGRRSQIVDEMWAAYRSTLAIGDRPEIVWNSKYAMPLFPNPLSLSRGDMAMLGGRQLFTLDGKKVISGKPESGVYLVKLDQAGQWVRITVVK